MTAALERVFVTGATGFLGTALSTRLREAGVPVAGLSLTGGSGDQSGVVAGDVRSLDDVRRVMQCAEPSHVFHVAGDRPGHVRSYDDLRASIDLNVTGAVNVVVAAAEVEARTVVVGTAEEYGDAPSPYVESASEQPTSPYGISKLAATRAAMAAAAATGAAVTVARLTVAYGVGQPSDMFVASLVRSLLAGQPFPMTSGEQTRDFVYIDDVVEGLRRVANAATAIGRIVNLGTGTAVRVRDAARLAEEIIGAPGLVRPGAVAARPGEPRFYAVDMTTTEEMLGWRPTTTLEDGLELTVRALRSGVSPPVAG